MNPDYRLKNSLSQQAQRPEIPHLHQNSADRGLLFIRKNPDAYLLNRNISFVVSAGKFSIRSHLWFALLRHIYIPPSHFDAKTAIFSSTKTLSLHHIIPGIRTPFCLNLTTCLSIFYICDAYIENLRLSVWEKLLLILLNPFTLLSM